MVMRSTRNAAPSLISRTGKNGVIPGNPLVAGFNLAGTSGVGIRMLRGCLALRDE